MSFLNRKHLKQDSSEKEKSGKGNLEKGIDKQDQSENGQF